MKYFYNDTENRKYFGFYNPYNHVVYIYDYSNQWLLDTVKLASEGPHAVSRNLSGVFIKEDSSIIVLEKFPSFLKTLNYKGELLDKINIFDKNDFGVQSPPHSNLSKPIIYNKDRIFFVGLSLGIEPIEDHTKLTNAYSFNLRTNKLENFLNRPTIYNSGQFGMISCYQLFCTENLNKTGIIYSFGLYENVIEVLYNGIINEYCMKSDLINNIKAFSNNLNENTIDRNRLSIYDEEISSYANIYSLPGSNTYIRVNNLGSNFKDLPKRSTFSIFNEHFKKIGECEIKDKIIMGYNIFSNDQGLHFQKPDQIEGNLIFYIYEVSKI